MALDFRVRIQYGFVLPCRSTWLAMVSPGYSGVADFQRARVLIVHTSSSGFIHRYIERDQRMRLFRVLQSPVMLNAAGEIFVELLKKDSR